MTHILVKWCDEATWDVYPVRTLVPADIAAKLANDADYVGSLAGQKLLIKWNPTKEPAYAFVIAIGSQKAMEKRRTKIASSNAENDSGASQEQVCCSHEAEVNALRKKVAELELKLEKAEQSLIAGDLVKDLKSLVKKMERREAAAAATAAEAGDQATLQSKMENIGNGVLVPSTLLATLNKNYRSQPNKLARHLVRIVFTAEERRGKSLNGKACNARKDIPAKECIDKGKMDAIITYVCSQCKVDDTKVKNSLSNMLSKESKE
uniref:BEN domain-containing protein n=1 Tax=Ixodes ricinus TaxID=34613 RepID=A0A131Y5L8_IXORI